MVQAACGAATAEARIHRGRVDTALEMTLSVMTAAQAEVIDFRFSSNFPGQSYVDIMDFRAELKVSGRSELCKTMDCMYDFF